MNRNRNIGIFLATFVVGAIVAFAARAALHEPYVAARASSPASEYAPMVANTLTPVVSPPVTREPAAESAHAGHRMNSAAAPDEGSGSSLHSTPTSAAAAAKPAATAGSETVNTRCAICGMPVDPSVPTLEYDGKKIGFGCRMCAPKFKADPDKYGPIYLRNEVIKR
jgi:YHS domain-containing protein